MIFVDAHEKEEIKKYVKMHADQVKVYDNFGADYAVGGYLIERKRWAEIAGRLLETDRDLYVQLDELLTNAETLDAKPVLLVEGDLGSELAYTQLPRKRVAEYLTGVSIMEIHTMLSTDPETTAKILAKLEAGDPPNIQRVRGSPPSLEEEPRFIVEGIQGLGPRKAEKLLDKFGNVYNLVNADVEDIQSIHGFGEKTAQQIYNSFRSQYE